MAEHVNDLIIDRQDGVVVVTMDRPKQLNALSNPMRDEIVRFFTDANKDPSIRVIVITGSGDKAFCAGADLKEVAGFYASMTPIQRRERGEREPGLGGITRNLDVGKPVVAAINGHCLAGGLEIALACDLRVASEHATFGLPEVTRGIIPAAGGTQRLPRLIPAGIALEMMLTGDPINAAEALRLGLVNRVVPAADLVEHGLALAQRIAANAPLAVQAIRSAVRRGSHLALEEAMRIEQFYAEPVRASEDAQEGLRAFAEKRAAVFEGR